MKIASTLAIVAIFVGLFITLSVPTAADDNDEEFSISALVTVVLERTPLGVFFDDEGLLNIPGHTLFFDVTGDLEGYLTGPTDTVIDLATGNGEAHARKNTPGILGVTWIHPSGEVMSGFFECEEFDVTIVGFVGFAEFECEGVSGDFDDAELEGTIDFSTPVPGQVGTMTAELELDD